MTAVWVRALALLTRSLSSLFRMHACVCMCVRAWRQGHVPVFAAQLSGMPFDPARPQRHTLHAVEIISVEYCGTVVSITRHLERGACGGGIACLCLCVCLFVCVF